MRIGVGSGGGGRADRNIHITYTMELRRNGADKTQEILGFRGRYMEKKTSKERTGSYK